MDDTGWIVVGVIASLAWAALVMRLFCNFTREVDKIDKERIDGRTKPSYWWSRRKGNRNVDQ